MELNLKLIGQCFIDMRHWSLDTARVLFWKAFEDLGLERTPKIYIEVLKRCGLPARGMRDRKLFVWQMNCGRSGRSLRRMCMQLGNRSFPEH